MMEQEKVTGFRLSKEDRSLIQKIGKDHTNNNSYAAGLKWLLNYYRKTISTYKGI